MDNKIKSKDLFAILDIVFDMTFVEKFDDRYALYKQFRDLMFEKYTDFSDHNIDEV